MWGFHSGRWDNSVLLNTCKYWRWRDQIWSSASAKEKIIFTVLTAWSIFTADPHWSGGQLYLWYIFQLILGHFLHFVRINPLWCYKYFEVFIIHWYMVRVCRDIRTKAIFLIILLLVELEFNLFKNFHKMLFWYLFQRWCFQVSNNCLLDSITPFIKLFLIHCRD